MNKNDIISSLRFLVKHKRYSIVNAIGLVLGFTSCLVIFLFIQHEVSFDDFHSNSDNIYRVNITIEDNEGNKNTLVNSPPALVPGIQGLFPELKRASRMRYAMRCLLGNGERRFYEDYGFYADSLFLEMFSFDLIAGSAQTALDEPNSIVLTRELALKYFENENPIGPTILLNNTIPLKVTGVISEVPSNSHLDFDFLISFPTYVVPEGYASNLESMWWLGFLTYVELTDGTDPRQFQDKVQNLFAEITPPSMKPYAPYVQALPDIYLGSKNMTDDLASHIRSGNDLSVY